MLNLQRRDILMEIVINCNWDVRSATFSHGDLLQSGKQHGFTFRILTTNRISHWPQQLCKLKWKNIPKTRQQKLEGSSQKVLGLLMQNLASIVNYTQSHKKIFAKDLEVANIVGNIYRLLHLRDHNLRHLIKIHCFGFRILTRSIPPRSSSRNFSNSDCSFNWP